MAIRFNCRNCDRLLAFPNDRAGSEDACAYCGQAFRLPAQPGEPVGWIEPEREPDRLTRPGAFYRALFVETWPLFGRVESRPGIRLVAVFCLVRFFLGRIDLSLQVGPADLWAHYGPLIRYACWGALFWYYLELLGATLEDAPWPDATLGGIFAGFGQIIKTLYLLVLATLVCKLPALGAHWIGRHGAWDTAPWVRALNLGGLLVLPLLLCQVGARQDLLALFRADRILRQILRAPLACLTALGLAWATILLVQRAPLYEDLGPAASPWAIAAALVSQLAIQALALVSSRALGLFYRAGGGD